MLHTLNSLVIMTVEDLEVLIAKIFQDYGKESVQKESVDRGPDVPRRAHGRGRKCLA